MDKLKSYRSFSAAHRGGVLAIGNFDGVHLGHKAVLQRALDVATGNGENGSVSAGVMFFTPHPRQFFSPDTPLFMLTNGRQKQAVFEELGLDFSLELTFDAALASMSAEDFVKEILVDGVGVSHVVIGYDFFFGRARRGNTELMRELGAHYGFGVSVVSPEGQLDDASVKGGGLIYSSTGVRDALEEGQVKRAAEILGRNFEIEGVVTSGFGRGEGLGFPTANIDLSPGCHLHYGIYSAFVHHKGARYQSAAYFGKRPSFDNDHPVLEVFLLDFEGNLYGEDIAVEFVDFVREDLKFSDLEELKAQMEQDCNVVRESLASGPL